MDCPHHFEPDLNAPSYDPDTAIEIAKRIWWVGSYLEDDAFQCHAYLVENGDDSVLIDPGSALTFAETRRKIESVVRFDQVRYLVCQHADPDIVAGIGLVHDELVRNGARLVTHWRSAALIRHFGWKLPIEHLDESGWQLCAGKRILRFIATPYLHFPGAVCTLDEATGVLFSSDLFGGFTEDFALFAEDEGYFEAMRPFHEHYMPSREILQSGLMEIERHPVRMIAPQHGSIIPGHLVAPMIDQLKTLDCGLLAAAPGRVDVARLSRLNAVVAQVRQTGSAHVGLDCTARTMFENLRSFVPEVCELELWALDADERRLAFSAASHFRPGAGRSLPAVAELLGRSVDGWRHHSPWGYRLEELDEGRLALVMPLLSEEDAKIRVLLVLHLDAFPTEMMELREIVAAIAQPLRIGIERELLIEALEQDKRRYYLQAIRDSLTGLFTRLYMEDAVGRMVERHTRNEGAGFALVLFDVDKFKPINDAYGHLSGDEVLRRTAAMILSECRKADIPVRFGGDEIAVFLADSGRAEGLGFAERVRLAVQQLRFDGVLAGTAVTVSAGFAEHRAGETLEDLLRRTDLALYEAKRNGRNRVSCATAKRKT